MSPPPPSGRAELIRNYLRGALMGAADVVPGVSGGTVALIVGIYERLVRSIRAAAAAPVALLRGDPPGARRCIREVEWSLVLPLGAGIITAVLVGAAVIPGLIERHPEETRAVFFGLIAASIPLPWRRIRRRTWPLVGVAAVSAVAAFILVGLPPRAAVSPAWWAVFLGAAVAICAMILPGISGAFLLLVLGLYEPTLEAISDRDIGYVAVFMLGAALGLGSFARLLDWLLDNRHDLTMAALVGLMIGALRALWPWLEDDRSFRLPPAEMATVGIIALAIVGFVAVTLLVRAGERPLRQPAGDEEVAPRAGER